MCLVNILELELLFNLGTSLTIILKQDHILIIQNGEI